MADHLRNHGDLFASVEQQGGERVPHVVKPLTPDAGPLLGSDEGVIETAPPNGLPVPHREDVGVVLPA